MTVIWDGWSTRKRRPYTSFSISFIDSPADNDRLWELKKYLVEFNSPVGRHTGELIGKDLVTTIRKFQLEMKVCELIVESFGILIYLTDGMDDWRWSECKRRCRQNGVQGA